MNHQNKTNTSEVLEYPFDFNRYIEERLREIDDLDERRFAKTVLLEGLGKIIECTEQKYRSLENRIYNEIETEKNQYEIAMTVINREHFDPTNQTLYPVDELDLEPEKLSENLASEGKVYMGTVFLEMEESKIQQLEQKPGFTGALQIDGERIETVFELKQAVRYREQIEGLYYVFLDNHIPWQTVNTGYLDRFYDVFISIENETDRMEEKLGQIAPEDCELDFGEAAENVKYNIIPLWNIERVRLDGADFMLPCTDGIYYEHEISVANREDKDGYLVQSNEDILEIRHEDKKLIIKSHKETFENWRLLHIVQGETLRSVDYDMPLLTNHKEDSFIRRYSINRQVGLMTKTDLMRRITELDIGEFIEVSGYEICDEGKRYPMNEGMNWFVKDELFPMNGRKVLLLKFREKKQGHYLNGSMVRFVTTQLQMEINEYRCVGVIV